jgi:hypothetical protein
LLDLFSTAEAIPRCFFLHIPAHASVERFHKANDSPPFVVEKVVKLDQQLLNLRGSGDGSPRLREQLFEPQQKTNGFGADIGRLLTVVVQYRLSSPSLRID